MSIQPDGVEHSGRDAARRSSPSVDSKVLVYPRHFLLLVCSSVLMYVLSRLHLTGNLSVFFALCGALHAVALVLAVRVRQAIWKKCLFIVMAAALCVMTFEIGTLGRQLTLPGNIGLYSLLGLSAVIGAASYGTLIRLSGMYALTVRELAAIAMGCMFAAFAGLITVSHFHFLGSWWLAALWWFTFSGGLWYFDQRHNAADRRPNAGLQR
jgi:hypothetical protein